MAPQLGHVCSVLSEFAHAVSAAQDAHSSFPALPFKLLSSQGLLEQRSQADISSPKSSQGPVWSQAHPQPGPGDYAESPEFTFSRLTDNQSYKASEKIFFKSFYTTFS